MTQRPLDGAQKLKFYPQGTLTVGNRLNDEADRTVQASAARSYALTSGHRACLGCGEALGARYAIDAAMKATGRVARNGQPNLLISVTVTYPPNMPKAQCARLTKFIMPSVTDIPTDSRNSNMP